MLAVVLPGANFNGDPNTDPAAQPLKNFVTQWGNDPIWLSPFVPGFSPKRENFPLARTAARSRRSVTSIGGRFRCM